MQKSLDFNKPFYFTPPEKPQVKRWVWTLPIGVAFLVAIIMIAGMAQFSDSTLHSTSAPSPDPQAVPTPTPTPTSTPTPIPTPSTEPTTPNQQTQTSSGLPWNANVRLDGAYKVLEVHAIPSSASGIIGILEGGDAVKILSAPVAAEGMLWVCIQKAGYSGWVRSEFLEVRQ